MNTSIILILAFLSLAAFVLVATEIRERRRARRKGQADDNSEQPVRVVQDTECCGRHAVCEKGGLLSVKPEITYYDDEELDVLAGKSPDVFSQEEKEMLREVFVTLCEDDVAGWLRSLQMRGIELPADIKEEALMIVADRRFSSAQL